MTAASTFSAGYSAAGAAYTAAVTALKAAYIELLAYDLAASNSLVGGYVAGNGPVFSFEYGRLQSAPGKPTFAEVPSGLPGVLFHPVYAASFAGDWGAAAKARRDVLSAPFNGARQTIVTFTVASPAVFTWAAHGLTAGTVVRFSTPSQDAASMPAGLSMGTDYYVLSAGLTTNAFEVSTSNGGAALALTGTGGGPLYCSVSP